MRLRSSTPFRLALGFSLAIVITFVLAALVAMALIQRDLQTRQDQVLELRYRALQDTLAIGGLPALITVARVQRVSDAGVQESLISLLGSNGRMLAGDPVLQRVSKGLSTQPSEALGLGEGPGYRVLAAPIGSHRVVIAALNPISQAITEVAFGALAWASFLVVGIALLGAAVVARRSGRAFKVISETLQQVAGGQFDARIPEQRRARDIEALVQEFNATLDQLERGVESVRQVSSDIAHDLRTPLSRVRMKLESALHQPDESPHRPDYPAPSPRGSGQPALPDQAGRQDPAREAIETALAELAQLDSTFSALLRIGEMESGARKARFRVFDAGELFENVADVYREVAEDAGDQLEFQRRSTHPAQVLGDRDLLAQLFANLIENAIGHCPTGTRIDCTLHAHACRVQMCVADNGEGIPAAEHDKVQRRLYRLEKSRTSQGSGLGLSLVKAIADLHEATLTLADNEPGLSVCLQLPPA